MFSFTATFLMARRLTECWIYWLVIDVVGVWLYYQKEVYFVALLYVLSSCLRRAAGVVAQRGEEAQTN
jgi:nicotinamide riboside transporter PnuC